MAVEHAEGIVGDDFDIAPGRFVSICVDTYTLTEIEVMTDIVRSLTSDTLARAVNAKQCLRALWYRVSTDLASTDVGIYTAARCDKLAFVIGFPVCHYGDCRAVTF